MTSRTSPTPQARLTEFDAVQLHIASLGEEVWASFHVSLGEGEAHQISHKAFGGFQRHMQQVQSPQQLCSLAVVGLLLQQMVVLGE